MVLKKKIILTYVQMFGFVWGGVPIGSTYMVQCWKTIKT
jgi:hypothetical protein